MLPDTCTRTDGQFCFEYTATFECESGFDLEETSASTYQIDCTEEALHSASCPTCTGVCECGWVTDPVDPTKQVCAGTRQCGQISKCINTAGSFQCECDPCHTLRADNQTCAPNLCDARDKRAQEKVVIAIPDDLC